MIPSPRWGAVSLASCFCSPAPPGDRFSITLCDSLILLWGKQLCLPLLHFVYATPNLNIKAVVSVVANPRAGRLMFAVTGVLGCILMVQEAETSVGSLNTFYMCCVSSLSLLEDAETSWNNTLNPVHRAQSSVYNDHLKCVFLQTLLNSSTIETQLYNIYWNHKNLSRTAKPTTQLTEEAKLKHVFF